MKWREREDSSSSNGLIRWFSLSCVSGVRPLFGAHPKIEAVFFVSLYVFVTGVQLSSLPRHVSQQTNFQTRVVHLLPPGIRVRIISVSSSYTPAQKIKDLRIFLVIFN